MIDENTLEQLLARAAEEIEVPVDGAARVEAAAERLERRSQRAARRRTATGGEESEPSARIVRSSGSRRVAVVAASVAGAGLIAAAALGLAGSSGPALPSAAHQGPQTSARSNAKAAIPSRNTDAAASPLGADQAGRVPSGVPNTGATGAPGAGSAAAPPAGPAGRDVASEKIESTGSMNLTVRHLDAAVSALTALVSGDGGYVAAEETQSASGGAPASGTVTLQVPQKSFSTLIGQIGRVGTASSVSTKQVDVTGQYVDLQAQITALRATQQQYLTIMTKAQSIGDILAVQQELNSIDSQLQQVEGELHLLDGETTYGTLTVDLSEPAPKPAAAPKAPPKPPTGLAAAWGSARHGFANGVYWVVRQTGGLAFLVLLAGLLYLLGRVGWRGLRRLAL